MVVQISKCLENKTIFRGFKYNEVVILRCHNFIPSAKHTVENEVDG